MGTRLTKPVRVAHRGISRRNGAINGRPRTMLLRRNPGKDLFSAKEWTAIGRELRLTERELEITMLIFEEDTRKKIARRIHRSHNTVHTITSGLYLKLGVHGHVGLVLVVVHAGLSLRGKR